MEDGLLKGPENKSVEGTKPNHIMLHKRKVSDYAYVRKFHATFRFYFLLLKYQG